MTIKKTDTLYERDEKGELLPQKVEVEIDEKVEGELQYKGETITVIPLSRGELKKLLSNITDEEQAELDKEKDRDGEIIFKYCKDPSYTEDEIKHLKPLFSNIIVNTIFRESGLGKQISRKKAMEKKEDDFSKNLKGSDKISTKEI